MARIVFDLDGTLIDSARDIHALANRVLAEAGADPITLDQTRTFVGNGAPTFVARMRAAQGLPEAAYDTLLTRFLTGYPDAIGHTVIFPGVTEALSTLIDAGHVLGICTNKPLAPAQAVIAHLDLARYFRTVIGGDSLAQVKPDPAPLMAAFDALGTGPQIYVGDSDVDAETAHRAGIPFLLYAHGYARTDLNDLPKAALFDDFTDLPGLVDQLLAPTPQL